MSFYNISFCNLNHVNCDTLVVDSNSNRAVFFSVIGYQNIIKASLKKINEEAKPYAYTRETGTIQLLKNGYEIEQKRQADGDYVHVIGYLKDEFNESLTGETLSSYIYYSDDEDKKQKVYDKLYKYFSVPMIPEWKDFIIEKLVNNRFLTDLRVRSGSHDIPKFKASRLYLNNNDLENLITNGLQRGDINIAGSNSPSILMNDINGLDSYLSIFGETLASKIQSSFVPMFTPGQDEYDEYVNNYDDNIFSNTNEKIEMYEAQKSVVQSVTTTLDKEDVVFVIGEMGSGKTLQGSGIPYAHHHKKYNHTKGLNCIVLCPGHLTLKWKREIETFVPNSRAFIINSIEDITNLHKRLANKNKAENTYIIVSKEDAKLSYEYRPCAVWSERRETFICPECGQPLTKKVRNPLDRSKWINQKFDELDMQHRLAYNSYCKNTVKKWDNKTRTYIEKECHATLWSPLNKASADEKWIKLGADGWLQRNHLYLVKMKLEVTKDSLGSLEKKQEQLLKRLQETTEAMEDDTFKEIRRGVRRYSIAKYIREHMKGVFDYSLIDEVHEYKGQSLQGQAACDIILASKKSILLTGTLLNGYASGLFYLLYRAIPRTMKLDGLEYNNEMEFTRRYGVTQNSSKTSGRSKKTTNTEKALPGISPIVFTKFLLNNAVFLSLSDMAEGLPQYQEIPLGIELDDELKRGYGEFERAFSNAVSAYEAGCKKIMGKLTESLTTYADCPHMAEDIIHPDTNQVVISPEVLTKRTRNKEIAVVNLIKDKIAAGEKVLVYYSWVNKTDIAESLKALLEEEGIDTRVMTSKVKLQEREAWVEKNIDDGMQVMICNPKLVETGLDLLDFTTIIFYQMGYNLFTLRQASRRSWRLSQDKDIEVYFTYYKDTIQEKAMTLMASKLQASMALEGKFSEEGLRAMSNNDDLLTQIASSVVDEIKDTVDESLFAAAKFMKKERSGHRLHLKSSAQLKIKMDEYGMKQFFLLRQKHRISKAKINKPILKAINKDKDMLLDILSI